MIMAIGVLSLVSCGSQKHFSPVQDQSYHFSSSSESVKLVFVEKGFYKLWVNRLGVNCYCEGEWIQSNGKLILKCEVDEDDPVEVVKSINNCFKERELVNIVSFDTLELMGYHLKVEK